jgi:hypothetical protein
VQKVSIGSGKRLNKSSCHMIVQAEVPSCDGWVPEEDVYVPPSVDSFEIAARPNMRKKSQKAEIKEIKRGLLSKTKSLNTISGFFRLASGPRKFFRNPIVHSLISFLSWQERYVILSTDRIDWFLPTHTHTHHHPAHTFTQSCTSYLCCVFLCVLLLNPLSRFLNQLQSQDNLVQGSMRMSKVMSSLLPVPLLTLDADYCASCQGSRDTQGSFWR